MAKATSLVRLDVESNQYERKIKQAQRSWNEFTRGIGLSVAKFTAVGAAVAGVTGAMKVVTDAFKTNELAVDEWGRTLQTSKALYSGFLFALNTGDISGYLNNMSNIVQAAREAYDAMDELGTFNAFNQINVAKTHSQLTKAIADYREGKGSKEDVQSAYEAYSKQLKLRQEKEQNAYEKAIVQLAETRKVSADDLRAILSGEYGNYEALKNTPLTGKQTRTSWNGLGSAPSVYEVAVPANEAERLGLLLRQLNDEGDDIFYSLQGIQSLGAKAFQTGDQLDQTRRMMTRYMGAGTGTGGSGGGSGKTPAKEEPVAPFEVANIERVNYDFPMPDVYKKQEMVDLPAILSPLQQMEEQAKRFREEMEKAATPEMYAKWADALAAVEGEMEKFKEGGKVVKDSWQNALGSVSQLGSALTSLEDPAAKVFGTVAQAVANVALGLSNALKTPSDPWSWIAAAAAGTATMISTIAAIKSSALTFADGGIIPGNSYSGDNQWARVNAGELILNRAQQGALASQISERERQSGGGSPYVTGDKIFLGINNYLRQSGRGQLVTTRG